MLLLDDMVKGIYRGVKWVVETIHEQVDKELNDENLLQEKFLNLRLQYEMGELSREDYEIQEAIFMERLSALVEENDTTEDEESNSSEEDDEWCGEYFSDLDKGEEIKEE